MRNGESTLSARAFPIGEGVFVALYREQLAHSLPASTRTR